MDAGERFQWNLTSREPPAASTGGRYDTEPSIVAYCVGWHVRHHPHDHVRRLRCEADEVPEGVVGRAACGISESGSASRLYQIRELDPSWMKKDRDVLPRVEVAFLGVKLHGEPRTSRAVSIEPREPTTVENRRTRVRFQLRGSPPRRAPRDSYTSKKPWRLSRARDHRSGILSFRSGSSSREDEVFDERRARNPARSVRRCAGSRALVGGHVAPSGWLRGFELILLGVRGGRLAFGCL